MWQLLLDLLFPRRSLTGVAGEWITEEERRRLASHPMIEEAASLRRRGCTSLDRLVAASTYAECPLLKKAIHTFKYGRVRELDSALGRLIAKAVPSPLDSPSDRGRAGARGEGEREGIALCPVPLHWMRRFQRGFNQSERLAEIVARERGLAVLPLLRRVRWTGSQAKRRRAERLTAVRDAFLCTAPNPPARVILIDDLSTTGATLESCARALKDAGVGRVEGWVIAHDQKRT